MVRVDAGGLAYRCVGLPQSGRLAVVGGDRVGAAAVSGPRTTTAVPDTSKIL